MYGDVFDTIAKSHAFDPFARVEGDVEPGLAAVVVPEPGLERGHDVQRMRRVALELAVALDAADHRRVEADARVEQEAAAVHSPEPDPRERTRAASDASSVVRRGDRVERDPERARVDVRRAAGERRERGVGAQPARRRLR